MPDVHGQICFLTPQRLQPDFPLFIFLPGMDGTGQLLRTQTAGLEAAFDVRCLAISVDDLTDWDHLTENLLELIKAEIARSSQRPVYLCGESFGGCLAIKAALHSPHLFNRIVLVNPASSFHTRPWIGWGAQLARWLPEPFFRLSSEALMPVLGNTDRISASDRKAFWETVQLIPQKTTLWRLALLNEFNVSEAQLRLITQPTLLLGSAADRLLPSLEEVRRLARLFANAHTVVLPNSGHACLLETDINLYEIMRTHNFLAEIPHQSPVESR